MRLGLRGAVQPAYAQVSLRRFRRTGAAQREYERSPGVVIASRDERGRLLSPSLIGRTGTTRRIADGAETSYYTRLDPAISGEEQGRSH